MQDDAELAAIRERLAKDLMAQAPAAPVRDHPVDVDESTFVDFVKNERLVLVDVWAPWCGPCRYVGPIVDALAKEMAGRVAFAKVNADENPRIMDAFGIQGIPTLLLFQDGRLVDRVTGALPKAQLGQWLERHAARAAGGTPGPRR